MSESNVPSKMRLVDHLRAAGATYEPAHAKTDIIHYQAADEIDQLTAALATCQTYDYRTLVDEIERLRAALKTVHKMAGGHAIECQCERCQIFEFLEPIVGNSAPDSSAAAAADDTVHVDFPKAWAPYLQAVIIGALNDFDSDCRWHLNELQKRLGSFSAETGVKP